ncbi:MAG: hypothetical protein BMS9Abin32_618 [Gammaproteobacteria bacterium]|nr:MAG: hypothetical protein BMS9Abin32_618 [Gammaproteobacteria bacterium]
MPFDCPDIADYANVSALNRAFLLLLSRRQRCRRWLAALPDLLIARISTLSPGQIDRLAKAPFLLFSVRERDDRFWDRLLGDAGNGDLFEPRERGSDDIRGLSTATLGFVWQVANKNPYTARLICGASLHWCELIAEQTLQRLLAAAATRNDLLCLRCPADSRLWAKLLHGGVSPEQELRLAAHLTALRIMLREPAPGSAVEWASAACASRQPQLQIAERRGTDI